MRVAPAIFLDFVDNQPAEGLPIRSRRTIGAAAIAAIAVLVSTVGIIIGMYIYFSGAFLNRIGANEIIGVQGRYYLVPISLVGRILLICSPTPSSIAASLGELHSARDRHRALGVLANIDALQTVLTHFTNGYVAVPPPPPVHY